MIDYATFEDIWDYIHQEKTISTETPILEEVHISTADDVLNSDGCTTKPDVPIDNFFIEEDEIGEEI